MGAKQPTDVERTPDDLWTGIPTTDDGRRTTDDGTERTIGNGTKNKSLFFIRRRRSVRARASRRGWLVGFVARPPSSERVPALRFPSTPRVDARARATARPPASEWKNERFLSRRPSSSFAPYHPPGGDDAEEVRTHLDAASRLHDRGHWCEFSYRCRSVSPAPGRRDGSGRVQSSTSDARFFRLGTSPRKFTRRFLSEYPHVRPIEPIIDRATGSMRVLFRNKP